MWGFEVFGCEDVRFLVGIFGYEGCVFGVVKVGIYSKNGRNLIIKSMK